MRLDHIEISVPLGTLTQTFATDLDLLLGDIFGWTGSSPRVVVHPRFGETAEVSYAIESGLRLIIREAARPLQCGQEDHLGLSVGSDEFARLAEACLRLASQHAQVELSYLDNGHPLRIEFDGGAYKTFFVRFLLPVWFQFETTETVR